MAKRKGSFLNLGDDEEQPRPGNEELLRQAIAAFAETSPPVPAGDHAHDLRTMPKLLRQFNEMVGEVDTAMLHRLMVEKGYTYEYGPQGFSWRLGQADTYS